MDINKLKLPDDWAKTYAIPREDFRNNILERFRK